MKTFGNGYKRLDMGNLMSPRQNGFFVILNAVKDLSLLET
jgi:hypothetical protein